MWIDWRIEVLVMAVIVALGELVLHWLPWRLILRRDLSRVEAYVLGVLGLVLPLSALLILWSWEYSKPAYPIPWDLIRDPRDLFNQTIVALWASIAAGGLAVTGAYSFDRIADKLTLADERGELLEMADGGQIDS